MNYYFLVEDSKTFYYLLPRWLEYVDFGCELVEDINFVKNNSVCDFILNLVVIIG